MFIEKSLALPAFFPDATYSSIHSLPMYLVHDKISGVVVTALHFKLLGLEEILSNFEGFRHFANLPENQVILSDSGGFQVFSLIHRNGLGKITEKGAMFKNPENPKEKILLTPELSQEIQHKINSDIRVTLDIPLMGNEAYDDVVNFLRMNTDWASRAKSSFLALNNLTENEFIETAPVLKDKELIIKRPLLFAVIQGANYEDLREQSAKDSISIGFDGFGFGGWPLDENGVLNIKILETFIKYVPSDKIAYGMGIGTPDDIVICHKMGFKLFDCVIPTRNARHGYLYVSKGNAENQGQYFDVLRLKKANYLYDKKPIDPNCDCPVCKHYTRSYLRFLFKSKNPIFFTLATLHNVWWYQNLMENLDNNLF